MKQRINRLTSYVENTENLFTRLIKRRRDSIRRSLIRPLYQEALKSFFIVIVIFIDSLMPLEIFLDLPFIVNIVLALVVLCILFFVEMRIYNSLWGKNGRWSLDKYKKISET